MRGGERERELGVGWRGAMQRALRDGELTERVAEGESREREVTERQRETERESPQREHKERERGRERERERENHLPPGKWCE